VASYEVRITRSAEKDFESLPKSAVPVIWQRITALAAEPRPRQARKLRGAEKAYRLRVRVYRVVYTIDDEQKLVTVIAVRHRREAYR
jgi:mRNA interferase RelE/StbE